MVKNELLYLRPTITPAMEPSATTLESMQRSCNPASGNRFPIVNSSGVEYSKLDDDDDGALKFVMVFPCDFTYSTSSQRSGDSPHDAQ